MSRLLLRVRFDSGPQKTLNPRTLVSDAVRHRITTVRRARWALSDRSSTLDGTGVGVGVGVGVRVGVGVGVA